MCRTTSPVTRAVSSSLTIAEREADLEEVKRCEMMNRYDRGAPLLADLKCEPVPHISKAIPELAETTTNVVPRRLRRW